MAIAEQISTLLKHAPAIIFVCDATGKIECISDYWLHFTGLSAESTALRWREFVHPKDLEVVRVAFEKALSDETGFVAEVRVRDAARDKYVWHIARVEPGLDQFGEIESWTGTLSDIDEQKKSQELLQEVMDSIPGAIWWKDCDSRYIGCNKTNAVQAGYDCSRELVGKTDHDCAWRDQAQQLIVRDRRVAQNDKPEYHSIEPVQLSDGRLAWSDTSRAPLHDQDGNVIGTVGNSVDISDRVRLIQQREDFMASLAHDLKVPIVGTLRALDVFSSGVLGGLNDEQREFLQKIHHSHEDLLSLIQKLLQVLRYEAYPDELQIVDCDIAQVARSCINEIQPMAQAKSITLRHAFSDTVVIKADAVAIKRLIINLLSNALKFTPGGGQVELVILDWQSDSISLLVTDTGIGISKQDQAKLFERFWKGGSENSYATNNGLGLYLCRQIAQKHGGDISVLSEVGAGASFVVKLPRQSTL